MCMCDDDDTCYVYTYPSQSDVGVHFYTYCGTDGCHMRVYSHLAITNLSTNEITQYSNLLDENGNVLPLSDPAYIKVHRYSCFGCPVKKSC